MNDFYATLKELITFGGDPDAQVMSLYLDLSEGSASRALGFAHREALRVAPPSGDPGLHQVVKGLLKGLDAQIQAAVDEGYQGLAAFVSAEPELYRILRLRFPFENQAMVGRDPYLRQLLFYAEEYEQSVAAIVRSEEVLLCEVHVGDLTHARHVRATERRSLAEEVHVELVRLLRESPSLHVILVGEPALRDALEAELGESVCEEIIGRIDGDRDPSDPHFLTDVHQVLQAYERRTEAEHVARLFEILGTEPERAALGLKPTLDAINQGRLRHLYVMQAFRQPGWLCDACDYLGEEPVPPGCLACGATVSSVAIEEHVMDQAVSVGAILETVSESEALAEAGGIGALVDAPGP